MQNLEVFLRIHHGAARYGTLTANGFRRAELERAVRDGIVVRPGRGTYAMPDAPADVVFAAVNGVSLTCISAARVLGWWMLGEESSLGSGDSADECTVHIAADRHCNLPRAVTHRGPRTAKRLIAAPRAIISTAFRCLPPLQALLIAECAVARNQVGLRSLEQSFTGPKDWPVRQLLRTIGPRTASPLEVCARFHLQSSGLKVEREVQIPGVGRVDFLVEGRLILEIDGYEFHSSRQHYRADRERWNAATALGWHTLRVTAEMVLYHPEHFLSLVRRALHH